MATMKNRGNRRKAKGTIRIPALAGVEGKRASLKPGRYTFKIVEVEQRDGQNDPYLSWKLEEVESGALVWYITGLGETSLWNLRGWLEALGREDDISEDDQDMDPSEYVGLLIECEVDNETYEGKSRAKVVDYSPAEEDDGASKKKRKPKAKASDEDDDEDEEDDAPPAKARKSKRNAKTRDAEEDEEEDDADDAEEAAPRGRKARKGSKKSKVTADEVNDMDEDELASLIEEHEVDVDLGDYKTLRKMRAAVIAAMDLE